MATRRFSKAALLRRVESGDLVPDEGVWPTTVNEHRANVARLPCVITAYPYRTLHHCHGGSLRDLGWDSGGMARKQNEALIIPVKADFHCIGPEGIDAGLGVDTWETWYGSQVEHLLNTGKELGYNLFELAAWWEVHRPKRR